MSQKNYVTHDNNILATDWYKNTHWLQYPNGKMPNFDKIAETVYSYMESRGGYSDTLSWFGLQMVLVDHFEGVRIEQWMIDDAEEFITLTGGFKEYHNRAGWQRIVDVHGGKLPIRIKALPEGLEVPVRIPLMTIESTDRELPWLTNWAETLLLQVWYTVSVATTSMNFIKIGKKYAELCGEEIGPFYLNDFGYRGTSSKQTAGRGGCAHLVHSAGSDTQEGIVYAARYYSADIKKELVGASVFATEHSTTTIYGRDNEHAALKHFIETTPSAATISLVSDSFNIYDAVRFLASIKDVICSREGKVVVRPDSGEPHIISHEVLAILWEGFGGHVNENGFKVLDPHIGMIYGDGINVHTYEKILESCVKFGKFAISNIIFGMGGGLLQDVNRDTHKFAIKCCAAKLSGQWYDVMKDPITDPGKVSKLGKQAVYLNDNGKFVSVHESLLLEDKEDLLEVVFENGEIVKHWTWQEIKANARK